MLPGNNPEASQLNYKEGDHLSGTQGSQVYTSGEGFTPKNNNNKLKLEEHLRQL